MTIREALQIILAFAQESAPDEDYVASLSAEADASELDSIADLRDALAILSTYPTVLDCFHDALRGK